MKQLTCVFLKIKSNEYMNNRTEYIHLPHSYVESLSTIDIFQTFYENLFRKYICFALKTTFK